MLRPGAATRDVVVPVREVARLEVPFDGADRDHPGVRGRVVSLIGRVAVVSRRGDEDDAPAQGVFDGLLFGGVAVVELLAAAERHVDDLGTVVDRIPDPARDGAAVPVQLGLQIPVRVLVLQGDPDGQDPRVRSDPDDPFGRTGAMAVAGDDAGHRGAVPTPVLVPRLAGVAGVVGSVDHSPGQVGLLAVDPGVQHRDDDPVTLGVLPGLADVQRAERPLLAAIEVGVRGRRCRGRRTDERGGGQCDRCHNGDGQPGKPAHRFHLATGMSIGGHGSEPPSGALAHGAARATRTATDGRGTFCHVPRRHRRARRIGQIWTKI